MYLNKKHYPSEATMPVPDAVVMQDGLLISEIWTKAAFDSNAEVPTSIQFENGSIIQNN